MHSTPWRPILGLLALLSLVVACDSEPLPTEEETTSSMTAGDADLATVLMADAPGDLVPVLIETRGFGQARSMAATIATAQRMNAAGNGPRLHRTYRHIPFVAARLAPAAVEALERHPGVVTVHPDELHAPALQLSLPWVNADDVHTLGYTGSGMAVAILDNGVDTDHPFFGGRVVAEACYSDGETWADTETLCPDGTNEQIGSGAGNVDHAACQDGSTNMCNHGTHVAGIAAGDGTGVSGAPPSGMAPGADIIAIQVFTRFNANADCGGSGPCTLTWESDYIAGLEHVYDLRTSYTIAAANMSLGGGAPNYTACDGNPTKTIIDLLRGAGIATVISAGNEGWADAVSSPGCISTAITVGSTYRDDDSYYYDNRGPLIDLFAPGRDINSSIPDGLFGQKSGTSMAAPHVTGAFAVLGEAFPSYSVTDIETRLEDTGVDVTYDTDGDGVDDHTTPRIDLLAAVASAIDPPELTVDDGSVTVDEGTTATNSGTWASDDPDLALTASMGSVTRNGNGTWDWSYPTTDDLATTTVTITATDLLGQTDAVTFDLTVNNVAPTVTIDPAQVTTIDENTNLAVAASFTDPGTDDTHTAVITCHSVGGAYTVPGAISGNDVTGTCPYGDDSDPTFAASVAVTDDDGGVGSAGFDVTVDNVDPLVAMDESGATLINGVPVVLASAGDPVPFAADASDPGSDDVTYLWDWDDGTTTPAIYLLDPPNPDPLPSPDIDPRAVTDNQVHTFGQACAYLVHLDVTDDDAGTGTDELQVVIGGNSGMARSHGYWQAEYRNNKSQFDDAVLDCYLSIAGLLSQVFDEETDASTQNKAAQVLKAAGNDMAKKLDSELLAVWLNFANGAFLWTDLVDTDGDKVGDTPFSDAVQAAEAVRLDPTSTDYELEMQKNILEFINTMHES